MNILMTADPIGGVWTYALELCAGFERHDIHVALATLGAPLSESQRLQTLALRNVTLYESTYRLEWMHEPWDDLARASDWLLDLESRLSPDLVHMNHLVHGDLSWNAPALIVGHSCVLSWWRAVRGTALPANWSRYRAEVTRSLQAARSVVAPTRALLVELERYYGPFNDSRVILNAREGKHFHAAAKEPIVFAAGRLWDPAKNIEAVGAVASRVQAPVYVAGSWNGPNGDTANLNGLQLLGQLDACELAEWYARAAIYALPARYEPFGLTVLEAALSGCALVLGDIPTLREVWGDAARYVHPDDHTALCNTLNRLLANPEELQHFSDRARSRARQLNPEIQAETYIRLYRELIPSRATARTGACMTAHPRAHRPVRPA